MWLPSFFFLFIRLKNICCSVYKKYITSWDQLSYYIRVPLLCLYVDLSKVQTLIYSIRSSTYLTISLTCFYIYTNIKKKRKRERRDREYTSSSLTLGAAIIPFNIPQASSKVPSIILYHSYWNFIAQHLAYKLLASRCTECYNPTLICTLL